MQGVGPKCNSLRILLLLADGGEWLAIDDVMKETRLTFPEIGLIAGTRVALGVGLGFLFSERLSTDQRRGAGWALLGIGAISSIPLLMDVLQRRTVIDKPIHLAA